MSHGTLKLPPADSELARLVESMCDGTITAAEGRRLESLLAGDREAQLFYVAYLDLHAQVQWMNRGEKNDECRMMNDELSTGATSADIHHSSSILHHSDASEPLIPPIVINTSPLSPSPPFVGGWLFSYGVATLLTGVAILGAWAYKVSRDYPATGPSRSLTTDIVWQAKPPDTVGRITGMADCHWADPAAAPRTKAIPLGDKYVLRSGLLEISYDTGAKVILQGPCSYEVDSSRGGFLSLGRLTARVETKGEGGRGKAEGTDNQKSEIGSQKSPFPLPPSPFVVKTPTAVVTDLGTEFGVEVDKSGATRSHVFRGKVELRVSAPGRKNDGQMIRLGENQSARVEAGPDQAVVVRRSAGQPAGAARFRRQMPKWTPIELWNTGVGLKEGDPDPHWQLVARSDEPKFQPQPAVVTSIPNPLWLENFARQSQWLSMANGSPDLPNRVVYTFRTTFRLAEDALPGTANVRCQFIADNYAVAIRLNGKPLPVPKSNGDDQIDHFTYFDRFTVLQVRNGFVEGTNSLEIDVLNGYPSDLEAMESNALNRRPGKGEAVSGAMGLRVELSGDVLADDPRRDGQPRGKEGTPVN